MSAFCIDLFVFVCNSLISLKEASFSIDGKLKCDLEPQFSLIVITLRWVLYLTIALMAGPLICRNVESSWLY